MARTTRLDRKAPERREAVSEGDASAPESPAALGHRKEASNAMPQGARQEVRELQGSPLLAVEQLRVDFRSNQLQVPVVNGIEFALSSGRTLGIVGESGSGKSVTARAIMGLLPHPQSRVYGSVRLEGSELLGMSERQLRRYRGASMALVFQDPMRSLNPIMRIGRQLGEAIRSHSKVTRTQAKRRAVELLEMVRVPAARQRLEEYPHQLSGGMRQRVVIAMALAGRPRLLIADEPTTALDVTTQAQIMKLLRELQQELGMALILISHDIGLAAQYTDEVAVMYAGRIVEHAPTRRLFSEIRMPYTLGLLESIPRLEGASQQPLPVLRGRPPDPFNMPRGCPFEPRCSRAGSRCKEELPSLGLAAKEHRFACFYPL